MFHWYRKGDNNESYKCFIWGSETIAVPIWEPCVPRIKIHRKREEKKKTKRRPNSTHIHVYAGRQAFGPHGPHVKHVVRVCRVLVVAPILPVRQTSHRLIPECTPALRVDAATLNIVYHHITIGLSLAKNSRANFCWFTNSFFTNIIPFVGWHLFTRIEKNCWRRGRRQTDCTFSGLIGVQA